MIFCILLENKITRHYDLGVFHKLMTHSLSVSVLAYFNIMYWNKWILKEGIVLTDEEVARRDERDL